MGMSMDIPYAVSGREQSLWKNVWRNEKSGNIMSM